MIGEHRLFLTLSFQLQAATLEGTDRSSLLILGSVVGVSATVLGPSVVGWPTQHQACWHEMEITFLKEGRGSFLTS